jgi:hypothetical protein
MNSKKSKGTLYGTHVDPFIRLSKQSFGHSVILGQLYAWYISTQGTVLRDCYSIGWGYIQAVYLVQGSGLLMDTLSTR